MTAIPRTVVLGQLRRLDRDSPLAGHLECRAPARLSAEDLREQVDACTRDGGHIDQAEVNAVDLMARLSEQADLFEQREMPALPETAEQAKAKERAGWVALENGVLEPGYLPEVPL